MIKEPIKTNLLETLTKIRILIKNSELKPINDVKIDISDLDITNDGLQMVLISLIFELDTDDTLFDIGKHLTEINDIILDSMDKFKIDYRGRIISSKYQGLSQGGILVDDINYSHRTGEIELKLDVMFS